MLENSDIDGLYGREPRVESLTLLRNDLYRQVEQSVKDWTAERKFIPRFLISTSAFLVVYFLTSFVIRDPIPMVDELLLGLAAAVVVYLVLMKRDSDSKKATEMKVSLGPRSTVLFSMKTVSQRMSRTICSTARLIQIWNSCLLI